HGAARETSLMFLEIGGPDAGQEEQGAVGVAAGEVVEPENTFGVGPLQVFDDERDGLVRQDLGDDIRHRDPERIAERVGAHGPTERLIAEQLAQELLTLVRYLTQSLGSDPLDDRLEGLFCVSSLAEAQDSAE